MLMKKYLILSLMLLQGSLWGQKALELNQLSAAYFGPFGYHPGARVGAQFSYLKWEEKKENQIFIAPKLGYFGKKHFYYSLLLSTDIGWKWRRPGKKSYSAFSLGLAYLRHSEVMTLTVDFSGNIDVTEWEHRNFFMPSLSYEFGRNIGERFGAYVNTSYGYRLSSAWNNTSEFLVEVGLYYRFKELSKEIPPSNHKK